MKKDLKELLVDKYGEPIVNKLLSPDYKVIIDNIESYGCGQEKVVYQIRNLSQKGLIPENLTDKIIWAFDFPGWIGNIELEPKEVMVIGLEPHIQNNDFQIAYGLGECKDGSYTSNHFLINRIHKLLLSNYNLSDAMRKMYITDLCHFAPRGNANQIDDIPNWSKIRENTAKEFLKREIDIIKPKTIIAQGKSSFKFLKKNLSLAIDEEKIKTGYKRPQEYSFQFSEFNGIKIIGAPHIGSEFNLLYKFWNTKFSEIYNLVNKKLAK